MSDQRADTAEVPKSAAAKLFDIRLLIGGLFTLYGVLLTIAGFVTSDSARHKASGININLWLGLGMLVVGLLFLLWRQLSPLRVEPNPTGDRTDEPADGRRGSR
jgi:xanthine/uracil/vitamin C permease (AzgA family)